jgi:toxin ParE1/3/4
MPTPLPVIWTPRAQRDLASIRGHIAADRPMAAERFAQRLTEAGNSLRQFPSRGRAAGASREIVVVRPYVIRYRVTPEAVLIVRIRHGAQRV